MNLRLELTVNDSVKDISATNHFKHFWIVFVLYTIDQQKIKMICAELDMIFLKVGRVLDVR